MIEVGVSFEGVFGGSRGGEHETGSIDSTCKIELSQ